MAVSLSGGLSLTGCSSTIVQHMKSDITTAKKSTSALTFFYFDFNDICKQNVCNFLSSILAQLCVQLAALPANVKELYDAYGALDKTYRPNVPSLFSTLLQVSRNWQHVYVVIDALDECNIELQEELLLTLRRLASSGVDFRIIATSRPEHQIKETIEEIADWSVCIQSDKVKSDIAAYVQSTLQRDPKMQKWPQSDKIAVEETLLTKAQGM